MTLFFNLKNSSTKVFKRDHSKYHSQNSRFIQVFKLQEIETKEEIFELKLIINLHSSLLQSYKRNYKSVHQNCNPNLLKLHALKLAVHFMPNLHHMPNFQPCYNTQICPKCCCPLCISALQKTYQNQLYTSPKTTSMLPPILSKPAPYQAKSYT